MGYELHIFRRVDWDNDEEESNIPLQEWLQYVESDKELELTNGYQDIFKKWQDRPGFCKWIKHSETDKDDAPWFNYCRGHITAKYPDDYTIMKMIQIAVALNAKVQGDDGEYYDDFYFTKKEEMINEELNKLTQQKIHLDKKRWWKFW